MTSASEQPVPNRLSGAGLIDRGMPLSFKFDGVRYEGFAGDTLASALLANGVRIVGRSFKYHRPRGILSAGSEEPNALVELRSGARREPNTRATTVELFDGLEATSQNRWPSLQWDIGAINNLLSPFLVAGFYYKTFMWPSAFWERLYEPVIRRAAGLGRASMAPDPDHYEKAHAHCDVLVIGGGPAGLSAALSAGRAGARVILCDEDFVLGGRLNAERREIGGAAAGIWAQQTQAELAQMPDVRILRRTAVFGVYDNRVYGAIERVSDHLPVPAAHQPRQRYWKIVAKRAILAAGATERPIVFGNNDRPGVMLASAVRSYINRFGATPGRNIAVFTCGDDGWQTAFDAAAAGVAVSAVIDARPDVDLRLRQAAAKADLRVMLAARVTNTSGRNGVQRIEVVDNEGRIETLPADVLAVGGGWNPAIAITTHLGGRPKWNEPIAAFGPGDLPGEMTVVGAANGSFGLCAALRQGHTAGAGVAVELGFGASTGVAPRAEDEPAALSPLWHVTSSTKKAFVDLQNDVTAEDISLASREGFRALELLKRYTTLGMATDQGKTSNLNGHAIMATLTGRPIAAVGTTVARPPYVPVAFGAIAAHHRGKHFRPTRLPPSHAWAEQRGAKFVETGQWLRAQWFTAPGESDWLQSVSREVTSVRSGVGVCDVSTFGKIDIQGADAAAFLDRVYVNTFSTLPIGRTRYGLMLREDGIVLDDGTTARLAANHFIMTTTTANAARVMQHLEHARQVLWPSLDVQMVSVSDQWAQYSVAGPAARDTLRKLLGSTIDLSNDSFPYLACAAFAWRGAPARLFRVSFSGEMAYELAVPARYGDAAIRAIMDAGHGFGITPYGTEALGVMRIEKGHVAGNELNGTTTAADLGLGRMMSKKKDYIGRVLAARPGLADPHRPALVGVMPVRPDQRLNGGAHFFAAGAALCPANDHGFVTSVAFSPTLRHWIGLGLLADGALRIGEIIRACDPIRNREVQVKVASPVFYDPEGARLHG